MNNEGKWKSFLNKNFLFVFFLGFASGLPLLLTGATLKTWLAREGVDISTIGYFSWVGMAYSFKFIWSPILDRYYIVKIGRRKTWLFASQIGLILGLASFSFLSAKEHLPEIAALAVLVAFFSATQDIAIDAYRREVLSNSQLGMGSSLTIYGYRIAMLISGGMGISLVGSELWNLSWNGLYLLMASLMAICFGISLFAKEPELAHGSPTSLIDAIGAPIAELFKRDQAWKILLFIVLFKIGDQISGSLLNPFYVQMGYSNADIGLIAKTFGLASLLIGLFLGGLIIVKLGIYRSLVIFGILQAFSTAAFAIITFTGPSNTALAIAVVFEDVSSGMGSAAFVAFLGILTSRKYTATQYALLSSLAVFGRVIIAGFGGDMQKILGWANFFYACALIAIPGLLMLLSMNRQVRALELEEPT